MKFRLLLFILSLSSYTLSAQESNETSNENKYFVGGSFFFNTNDGGGNTFTYQLRNLPFITPLGGTRNTVFSVSPYIAKQHNEQWAYGVGIDFSLNRVSGITSLINNEIITSNLTRTGYSFYTFARYTSSNDHKLKFYIQPSLGINRINSNTEYEDSSISDSPGLNTTQGFLTTGFGLQYNVTDRFRLLANLGDFSAVLGRLSNDEGDFSESFNSVGLNFGTESLRIGGEFQF